MQRVLVVSPEFDGEQTETSNFAQALCELYQSLGVHVEVITIHHGGHFPSYEFKPGRRIHRIKVRPSTGAVSFAPSAMTRVLERVESHRIDALLTIDTPTFDLVCVSKSWGPPLPPRASISTRAFAESHPQHLHPTHEDIRHREERDAFWLRVLECPSNLNIQSHNQSWLTRWKCIEQDPSSKLMEII